MSRRCSDESSHKGPGVQLCHATGCFEPEPCGFLRVSQRRSSNRTGYIWFAPRSLRGPSWTAAISLPLVTNDEGTNRHSSVRQFGCARHVILVVCIPRGTRQENPRPQASRMSGTTAVSETAGAKGSESVGYPRARGISCLNLKDGEGSGVEVWCALAASPAWAANAPSLRTNRTPDWLHPGPTQHPSTIHMQSMPPVTVFAATDHPLPTTDSLSSCQQPASTSNRDKSRQPTARKPSLAVLFLFSFFFLLAVHHSVCRR
jgi:hypothetical protein